MRLSTFPDIEYFELVTSLNPSSSTSVTTKALAAAGNPPRIATYQGTLSDTVDLKIISKLKSSKESLLDEIVPESSAFPTSKFIFS